MSPLVTYAKGVSDFICGLCVGAGTFLDNFFNIIFFGSSATFGFFNGWIVNILETLNAPDFITNIFSDNMFGYIFGASFAMILTWSVFYTLVMRIVQLFNPTT